MIKRFKVVVKYLGTSYFGWQKQPDVVTVQGRIEEVLSRLHNETVVIYGSGRTDAGVHAKHQVFHFDARSIMSLSKLKYTLNKMLPNDIEIIKINYVSFDFHARFSAKKKHYVYRIINKAKEPFNDNLYLLYPEKLNFSSFKIYIKLFEGEHNFANFTSKKEDERNFVRVIEKAYFTKKGNIFEFHFVGEGFMHGQVRMMVGALLATNEGKITKEDIENYLNLKERTIINYKSPAKGLYLEYVGY